MSDKLILAKDAIRGEYVSEFYSKPSFAHHNIALLECKKKDGIGRFIVAYYYSDFVKSFRDTPEANVFYYTDNESRVKAFAQANALYDKSAGIPIWLHTMISERPFMLLPPFILLFGAIYLIFG